MHFIRGKQRLKKLETKAEFNLTRQKKKNPKVYKEGKIKIKYRKL